MEKLKTALITQGSTVSSLAVKVEHTLQSQADTSLATEGARALCEADDVLTTAKSTIQESSVESDKARSLYISVDNTDAIAQIKMFGVVGAPAPPAFLPSLVNVDSTTATITWEPLTIPGVTQPSGALATLTALSAAALSLEKLTPGGGVPVLAQWKSSMDHVTPSTDSSPSQSSSTSGRGIINDAPAIGAESHGIFQVVAGAAASLLASDEAISSSSSSSSSQGQVIPSPSSSSTSSITAPPPPPTARNGLKRSATARLPGADRHGPSSFSRSWPLSITVSNLPSSTPNLALDASEVRGGIAPKSLIHRGKLTRPTSAFPTSRGTVIVPQSSSSSSSSSSLRASSSADNSNSHSSTSTSTSASSSAQNNNTSTLLPATDDTIVTVTQSDNVVYVTYIYIYI